MAVVKCTYRCDVCGRLCMKGKSHCKLVVTIDQVIVEDVDGDADTISCPYSATAPAVFKLIKKTIVK